MAMIGIPARHIPAIARSTDERGFVYVLEFNTGVTKVGSSVTPAQRLRVLIEQAEPFDNEPIRAWLTPLHENYAANEHKMLKYARCSSQRSIREYFHGLPTEAMVKYAGALTYDRAEPVVLETHCANGHELIGDNLVNITSYPYSRRGCHACGDRKKRPGPKRHFARAA